MATYKLMHDGPLIAVRQHTINGQEITFNPDDERYYVTLGEDTVATFKRFSNAVYYCVKRPVPTFKRGSKRIVNNPELSEQSTV